MWFYFCMFLYWKRLVLARILIIDDDEQMRAMLRIVLVRAGYEILEAKDGVEGINVFRNNSVDLVITDVVMPGKEGIETLLELRREAKPSKIAVMSGGGKLGPDYYLQLAEKFGADAVLSKPVEREHLIAEVERLLSDQ